MNDEARVEAAARGACERWWGEGSWEQIQPEVVGHAEDRNYWIELARAALAAVDAHDEKEGDLREWVVRCARNCRNLSRIWHETGDDTTADAFLAIALGAERVSGTTQEGTGEA